MSRESTEPAKPGNSAPVNLSELRWLYGFLRPQHAAISALILLSLLASSLALLQPWFTKLIIDDGLLASDYQALLIYSFGLLTLGIGATGLAGYSRIMHTRLSGAVLFALREDVFAHLQQLSPLFFARQRSGDLISRIDRDIAEIQRFAVDTLFSAFSAIIGIIGICAMMIILSWKLSLVLLIITPIQFIYLKIMRPKVEQGNRRLRERSADITSFFTEKIPAIKFIQSAAGEKRESDKLARLNHLFLGDLLRLQKTEFWTSAFPTVLLSSARACVFLFGGYWVIEGQLALGSLIAFSVYLGMAMGPVQSLFGLYMAWQRLRVSLERVSYIRQQQIPATGTATRRVPTVFRGKLDIEALNFSYEYGCPVFTDASLHIAAGSKVGLCGATGIGKTTLLDLLQRHLRPNSGRICIDGIDIEDFDLKQWRQRIAVVPQDPVIFHDTLASNISYSAPHSTKQEVLMAAYAAGLRGLIESLPKGINTMIAERGFTLSGGECQRIALSRALLQKPAVLLLDEPTSAVDHTTETLLMAEVDRIFSKITRIIISHRPSILNNADLIVTIENGSLVLSDLKKELKRHAG